MATDCPDQALGEALEPYLRPRSEVVEVREKLHAYLEKNLRLEDKSLSITNLTAPTCAAELLDAPEGLSGVRKAYWNALQAHQQAQARYRQLKAEIEDLSKQQASPSGIVDASEEILPLLRQREKQRKLGIISQALTNIAGEETAPSGVVIEEYVKVRAGDMPVLPSLDSVQHGYIEEADSRMLELKKAILTAKHIVDNHEDTPTSDLDQQTELHALEQTRNMLIDWIETQLTAIGESQAANEKPVDSLAVAGAEAPIPVTQTEIKQIYSQYLLARRKLLQAVQHPHKHDFESIDSQTIGSPTSKPRADDTTEAMAASILPYIEPILAMQMHQDALTQQIVASRRQLETAESETKQLLRRLAHESHLVVPGASSGREWEQASLRANAVTSEHVNSKVTAGARSAKAAEVLLDKIDALPASVKAL